MLEVIQHLDETVLRWIASNIRAEWLNPAAVFYTTLGNGGLIFIAISVVLLFFCKTRKAGISSLMGMLLGLIVTNLTVKPLVGRLRPWVVMEYFEVLVTSGDLNSFPSGHTCAAFAFAAALCAVLPQRWAKAAALIAAALMGFSRLYVGVHFPTDVLAGAAIGIACGVLGAWVGNALLGWINGRRAAK